MIQFNLYYNDVISENDLLHELYTRFKYLLIEPNIIKVTLLDIQRIQSFRKFYNTVIVFLICLFPKLKKLTFNNCFIPSKYLIKMYNKLNTQEINLKTIIIKNSKSIIKEEIRAKDDGNIDLQFK